VGVPQGGVVDIYFPPTQGKVKIGSKKQCSEAARPAADRTSDLQSGQIKSLILEAAQSLGR